MATLTFHEARQCVLDHVVSPASMEGETVWLSDALGRVTWEDIRSDRDMPPLARSLRDGYAVRSADLRNSLEIRTLRITGEIRAGVMPVATVAPGEALSIMTGAVIPTGADQVVMKEHAQRDGDMLQTERRGTPGEWISPAGSMASKGGLVVPRGQRIDASVIAMLATVGRSQVRVSRQPVVRILATGDEVVDIARFPNPTQVRNSNSWSLASYVRLCGGSPEILPIAPDEPRATRDLLEYGLQSDLLLISGGVSAGDYDFVEQALAALDATFFFDRVTIQPGQPTVFGRARGTFFFGLPGNPLSTMVTFRIFAQAALERLSGLAHPRLETFPATLSQDYQHKPGLTRFLPAMLSPDGFHVELLPWQGSGDIPALVRANCLVVVDEQRPSWKAGETILVIAK
jgi:molybdopterin molybdotransferase